MPWKFTWPQSGICTKQYTQKATHTQTRACCTDCPTVISSPAFRTSQHCLLEQWVRHITLPRDELDTENLKCSRKCLQQSAFMQTFTAVCAHANVYCSLCSCQLLLQSVLMQTFTAILTSASQHVNCEAGAWSDTASVKCDFSNSRLLWSTHLTVLISVQLTHTASSGGLHPSLTH